MTYDRRDQIGHWVKKDQQTNRHCKHACCRGYREHPGNWPIIPGSKRLRGASDEQLAAHYRKVSADESRQARAVELQIIHELERRDRQAERERDRQAARQAIAANRAAARQEREAETERIRVQSEEATRGYLVNAKGRARGIHPDEILKGRQAIFDRYASDEAKDYFAAHPRPTAAYFRGQDTRYVERAGEPRRKRRGVVQRRA